MAWRRGVILSAALGAAVALALAHAARVETAPASMPATMPAATQPATSTAPAEVYPSEALVAACRAAADELREALGDGFHVEVDPPFVVAGNFTPQRVKWYLHWSVARPAATMWKSYFRRKPDKVITVLLFGDGDSYRREARRLFGDDDLPHFGYYKPTQRTLVMNISTGSGTLVHELTHALVAYDFPDVPTWFNEGLASLHEQCNVGDERIVGLVNWRLPILQDAIRQGRLRPLRELVTRRDFYGVRLSQNYAQARYFVMYMQERGVLAEFYAHFREDAEGDDADVKAVEHVFGEGLEEVEKAFLAWVMTLTPP